MNIPVLLISLAVSFVICLPFIIRSNRRLYGEDFFADAKRNSRIIKATLKEASARDPTAGESYYDQYLNFLVDCSYVGTLMQRPGSAIYYHAVYNYTIGGKAYKKTLITFRVSPTLDLYYEEGNPRRAYALEERFEGKPSKFGYWLVRILPFVLTAALYFAIPYAARYFKIDIPFLG